MSSMRTLRAVAVGSLLAACGGEQAASEAAPETPPAAAAPAEPVAEAPPAAPEAPAAPGSVAIPSSEAPPAGAPSLPGTEFPSFGTFRAGAPAYFPTMESAEKLRAGNLADAGMTYFRGTMVRHDAATATVTVRDLQNREFDVPASYVLQAREPVTQVETGQVYRGVRFNRPELVMVTSATADERGQIPTLGLAGFMPDTVRAGSDELAALVPVVDGGIGSQAVCRGPNGVRGYTVLRRAPGQVLGYDGSFIRVLPEERRLSALVRAQGRARSAMSETARAAALRNS